MTKDQAKQDWYKVYGGFGFMVYESPICKGHWLACTYDSPNGIAIWAGKPIIEGDERYIVKNFEMAG